MEIVLLTDVPKVGKQYDVTRVPNGYALNYLIPQRKALVATKEALRRLERERRAREEERRVQRELLEKSLQSLEGAEVTLERRASEEGNLFAGIGNDEIAQAVTAQARIAVPVEAIEQNQPIKKIGNHTITVSAGGSRAAFTLRVEPENKG